MQKPGRFVRALGLDIENQPGHSDRAFILIGAEARLDDGLDPCPGCRRGLPLCTHRSTEVAEDPAHRGEKDEILGAEIMMRQGRRHAGASRDLAHGHVETAGLADFGNGRLNERFATQRLHPKLRHVISQRIKLFTKKAVSFFNCLINQKLNVWKPLR